MHLLPQDSPAQATLESIGPDVLPVLEAKTPLGRYRISLQGAQLLEWAPLDQPPVIWLSPDARFTRGKSPRGGVPICWPWFGPGPAPDRPAHGSVRGADWTLIHYKEIQGGAHELIFLLDDSKEQPPGIRLEARLCIGSALTLSLTTTNLSPQPFSFSGALHSYFGVSDVRTVSIKGLGAGNYLDRADADREKTGIDPLVIDGETDRIYLEAPHLVSIEDPGYGRRIMIQGEGAGSVIVWNPWEEKANRLGDLGSDNYLKMVCVESGHAMPHALCLAPGARHQLTVNYSVESI